MIKIDLSNVNSAEWNFQPILTHKQILIRDNDGRVV